MKKILEIKGSIEEMPRARGFIEERLGEYPFNLNDKANLVFSSIEAVVNAIKHGCGNDSSKKVIVSVEDVENGVAVIVSDEGPGFDPSAVPDPTKGDNPLKPGGRGIFFMRQMMSEARIDSSSSGTTVTLVKYFNGRH